MHIKIMTKATELFFMGFPELGELNIFLFILVLVAYTTTMFLDSVIIVLASTRENLHSPMYFFLKNFLFSELCLVTLIVPVMLCVLWKDGMTISIAGCITQSFLCSTSGNCECYLLAVMSYDRYLAICKPLHYKTIMGLRLQYLFTILCWMISVLLAMITLGFLVKLKFCEQNTINHFFCDLAPLVDLACSDTSALQINMLVLSFPIIVIPFASVVVSYVVIFAAILRMKSILGRKKAFSTCSTHLTVVGLFYGTLLINYSIPVRGHPIVINKMISMIAIIITPMFSPIIYSLRNKDMRAVLNNYIRC